MTRVPKTQLLYWALGILLLNTAYLAAFASPTVFYFANVVVHMVLGVAVAAFFAVEVVRRRFQPPRAHRTAVRALIVLSAIVLAAGTGFGILIMFVGAAGRWRWLLPVHIGLMLAGGAPLLALAAATRLRSGSPRERRLVALGCAATIILAIAAPLVGASTAWRKSYLVRNPTIVPASMNEEGRGPKSPFFPSSADTNVKGIIPANFFMTSDTCARCHPEIYDQWKSSMHHFSSFNNQWYRKSIEYMQDVVGTQAVEMVRRLPRSRGVLQRPVRPADQGTDRHAGGAGRARVHVVPLDHARATARWARGTSRSNIRRCTTWPRATNPVLRVRCTTS